jgi:hypothetical protein
VSASRAISPTRWLPHILHSNHLTLHRYKRQNKLTLGVFLSPYNCQPPSQESIRQRLGQQLQAHARGSLVKTTFSCNIEIEGLTQGKFSPPVSEECELIDPDGRTKCN